MLSIEKLTAGIFDGLQIKKLMKDSHFQDSMNNAEADEWPLLTLIVRNFFRNYKADNYFELVKIILSFCQLGCKMSITFKATNHFSENLGDLNEEQGKWFHQDLRTIEETYRGHWDTHMLAEDCWSIQHDCPGAAHNKKSLKLLEMMQFPCQKTDQFWHNF